MVISHRSLYLSTRLCVKLQVFPSGRVRLLKRTLAVRGCRSFMELLAFAYFRNSSNSEPKYEVCKSWFFHSLIRIGVLTDSLRCHLDTWRGSRPGYQTRSSNYLSWYNDWTHVCCLLKGGKPLTNQISGPTLQQPLQWSKWPRRDTLVNQGYYCFCLPLVGQS
jgi:hypothetical protein